MSESGYNFQEDLKKAIFGADEKLDKKELLVDIFKAYVAKLFELVLMKSKQKNRIEFEAMVQIKKNLISEFRAADLSEYQKSEEGYSELFEETVQEIFNDAALNHRGEDLVYRAPQNLEIDVMGYAKQASGLYMPTTPAI